MPIDPRFAISEGLNKRGSKKVSFSSRKQFRVMFHLPYIGFHCTSVCGKIIVLTYMSCPGGHWPRKGVWGCAALKTPFSRLSCRSQGSHFKQKSQFTRPLLRTFRNFSLNSLNFHPKFSSQAPKFGNFQLTSPQIWKFSVHKPPNLEIFSSQAPKFGNFQLTSPPFQRQMSVHKPHTSEIRAAHPYLKKSWVPPPSRVSCTTLIIPKHSLMPNIVFVPGNHVKLSCWQSIRSGKLMKTCTMLTPSYLTLPKHLKLSPNINCCTNFITFASKVLLTHQWTSSFLVGRQQSVNIQGAISKPVELMSGVPQGTVLGPIAFCPTTLHHMCTSLQMTVLCSDFTSLTVINYHLTYLALLQPCWMKSSFHCSRIDA